MNVECVFVYWIELVVVIELFDVVFVCVFIFVVNLNGEIVGDEVLL